MNKALLVTLCIAGCGGDAPVKTSPSLFIEGFNPPAAMAGEVTYISPALKNILPGSDVTYCTYLDQHFPMETDVVNFRVFQSTAGHHAIVFAASKERPVDTHVCTDDDMFNTRLVAAGGSENAAQKVLFRIPDGLSFRIPGNSQLMIQTHWINATDKTIDGQVVAYLSMQPSSAARTPLDLFNVVSDNFAIPAGRTAKVTTTCMLKHDIALFSLDGHQHELGSHVAIELLDGASATMLWSYDWLPEYQANPPVKVFSKEQPLALKAGQQIKVTCDWKNTTARDVSFPREMCVGSGFYFPGHGEIDCVEGVWSE